MNTVLILVALRSRDLVGLGAGMEGREQAPGDEGLVGDVLDDTRSHLIQPRPHLSNMPGGAQDGVQAGVVVEHLAEDAGP